MGITALCEALRVGLQSFSGMYGRNASALAYSQGVVGDQALESIVLCMARILHGRLSCKQMLTDSLYTPSQFLHSPLESEPDVLAVLMGERGLRCFMLMLSVGLGPAFPMNLNKGSRKLHFQAFDRLVPVQKQRGSTLCILAYSSPAGFSLLIVLSCAFIFYREKNSLSVLKRDASDKVESALLSSAKTCSFRVYALRKKA